MTEYIAKISDGMSRNGGGEIAIRAATLTAAVDAAKAWAQQGDYAAPCTVRVYVDAPDGTELAECVIRVEAA